MAKYALLIGVSEYESGLNPLPASVKDVEVLQRILQNPEIGSFAEVTPLINPTPQEMQEAVETLFAARKRDDLVLLFFSGHGIKDDSGKLYFGTRITRKTQQGELVKSTAVPANFVHDIMESSRSKRQVVILDCCFGGAFAEGLAAKGTACVDIKEQLGGEGRAILTSSTSTQYSFEQESSDLSVYTRYLIEGIETGLADQDNDGMVSVDELHEYASSKVREVVPAMKPEIYAIREGFKIHLLHAPVIDPKLRYRKEVERLASQGEVSEIGRCTLDFQRERLGISRKEAAIIEAEVIEPYREYREKLQRYRQIFEEVFQRESPLSERTRNELLLLQKTLELSNEDISIVEARTTHLGIVESALSSGVLLSQSNATSSTQSRKFQLYLKLFILPLLLSLAGILAYTQWHPSQKTEIDKVTVVPQSTKDTNKLLSETQRLVDNLELGEAMALATQISITSPADADAKEHIYQQIKIKCTALLKEFEQDTRQFSREYGQYKTKQIKTQCLKVNVDFGYE